ncbi:MAG: SDR family NAD(P)-dependent oxidoreductase [Candidatus Limnocylindria bacterium]
MIRELVDLVLEISVVGSFSRIGYAVRSRLFHWTQAQPGSMAGRSVLITGPTSGLGRRAAEEIAALGARVILVGRSPERLSEVRDALVATHGADRFPMVVADMSSLESVRGAVAQVISAEPRLDVLIDNAGAIFADRAESPDGIELTFAIFAVGPFALISGLVPLMRATSGSRVITVTSGGMYGQGLHLDNLQWEREAYSGTRAYARAKRAQVVLMREWARRSAESGITFNAMHPGWADTPGLSASLPGFQQLMKPILRTPAEGVDTLVWLASGTEGGATSGALLHDRRPRPFDRLPSTRVSPAERRELWRTVERLAGLDG